MQTQEERLFVYISTSNKLRMLRSCTSVQYTGVRARVRTGLGYGTRGTSE